MFRDFVPRLNAASGGIVGDHCSASKYVLMYTMSNAEKIQLHSELSLIQMHAEDCLRSCHRQDEVDLYRRIVLSIVQHSSKLTLHHRAAGSALIDVALEHVRLFGVLLTIMCFAIFFILPCTVCHFTDDLLARKLQVIPDRLRFNVVAKRIAGYLLLMLSGIVLVVEDCTGSDSLEQRSTGAGIDKTEGACLVTGLGLRRHRPSDCSGSSSCSMLCFTHASSIDPFVLAALVSEPCCTLAKADLFLLPFFGWLIAVWGGAPIDRSNRSSAIRTLQSVKRQQDCSTSLCGGATQSQHRPLTRAVAIAPEGTRSVTGQLLSFKKGPFHLWEHLQQPTLYPLLIMGAFELMPPPASTSSGMMTHSSAAAYPYSQVSKRRADDDDDSDNNDPSLFTSRVVSRKPVTATPGKVCVRLLPPVAAEEESGCYEDLAGYFQEHGVDIADFEEAFEYFRRKSSPEMSPMELVATAAADDDDADGASPLLPHRTAPAFCMRDRMSRRMKLSMAMSLGSAYPAGAGGPLTQQEHRTHLAWLFACIGIDLLLLRGLLYDLFIRRMGYSWLQVAGGFACYSMVVTAVVYLVKVKAPQCVQPEKELLADDDAYTRRVSLGCTV